MWKLMKLQRKNPPLRHIGQLLISSQEAANYLAKMKFEAGAIEPPCKTLPGPEVGGRTAGDPRCGVRAIGREGQPSADESGHQGRLSAARSTGGNPTEMHRGRGDSQGRGMISEALGRSWQAWQTSRLLHPRAIKNQPRRRTSCRTWNGASWQGADAICPK